MDTATPTAETTAPPGNDVGTLVEDARAFMAATVDVAGQEVEEARKQLAAALEECRAIYARARVRAVAGAQTAGEAVQRHPYEAIAIAFGVGAIVGYLATSRCGRHGD